MRARGADAGDGDVRLEAPGRSAGGGEARAWDVRGVFDRHAAGYERRYARPRTIFDGEKLRRRELVVRWVREAGPSRVLDAGCGVGSVLAPLRAVVPEAGLTGIDFSAVMIREAAARHGGQGAWMQADVGRQPFRDASFDFVYALGVMDYLEDHRRLVSEAFRVLRPGGLFVFTHPNGRSWRRGFRDWLRRRFKPVSSALAARPIDCSTVEKGLRDLGFEVLARRFLTYGNGLVHFPWAVRLSAFLETTVGDWRSAERFAWSVAWVVRRARGHPVGDLATGESWSQPFVDRVREQRGARP